MNVAIRMALWALGLTLSVGLAEQAVASTEGPTSLTRRNFLRGAGAVAISPVLPKPVVELALPLAETTLTSVADKYLSEEFFEQLAARLHFSTTSYLLDHRVSQWANGFFTAIDNSHNIPDLKLRQDVFARVVDMNAFETDGNFLSDVEKDFSVAEITESFFTIAEDVAQDSRFSIEFVERETITLIRMLEGSAGVIMREDQRLREQGKLDPLVRAYRQMFLSEVKQRHPIVYRNYLHNWNIGRGSVYRVAQVMGFADEDVETYRSLRALLNYSNDPGEYLTGEDRRLYFEEKKKQAERIEEQNLGVVRGRILAQIQSRAQSCEQLLVSEGSVQVEGKHDEGVL